MMPEEAKRKFQDAFIALGKGIATLPIRAVAGEEYAHVIVDAVATPKGFTVSEPPAFSEYQTMRDAIADIKKLLHAYTNKGSSRQLVIIIDELDRCKPSFAIETLEYIKHMFFE